jgi:hypothetical protein
MDEPLDMIEDASEAPEVVAAQPYLDMIEEAEKAFQVYQDKCDSIDKLYASLKTLSDVAGDREFQIFWANLEVLKPTIYSRPPQPVVQPRHSKGQMIQIARQAAELLERVLHVDIEADDLHETLIQVRDDLALSGRGVPWVLDNGACTHVDRCDFLHEPARKWQEVGWVARRAYLTRDQVKQRFPDCDVTKITFEQQASKDDGVGNDYRTSGKKAAIWEMWHRGEGKVVWLVKGYDTCLDVQPPLVDVKGFFPCPKPAYGTLERRTLKPVPDFVYYRDQVDEINELTARISSLSESLRLKGFYASGTSEVGEAIEAAMRQTDNKAILVPVSNFAALGGGSLKDAIVWLPVKEVADVITACIALRRQLIEDVYEITGLSDIMRGSTEASETATAQNLKAQYGSVRVRERQAEMVRVARDVIRLKAEIMAETVPAQELAVIAQMEMPDAQAVMMQTIQARQGGGDLDTSKIVTIEQVDALLKNERLRPFVLDVESDSTIAPNEEAEKASRIEFISAVGSFIQQAGPMVASQPQSAPFAAEMLKFTANSFRGGRELQAAIDEFAEQIRVMGAQASQPQDQGPSPEAMKMQADMAKVQMEMQKAQAEMQVMAQQAQADLQKTLAEIEKIKAETVRIMAQASQPAPQPMM